MTCLLLSSICTLASITVYAATQGTRTLVVVAVTASLAISPPLYHVFVPL